MELSQIPVFIQSLLANSIVLGIAAWAGKGWADRRLESMKGAHAKQLEGVKGEQAKALETVKADLAQLGREMQASVEKKMMVFKTHFELEFGSYREIWALCDKSHDLAVQTRSLYEAHPTNAKAIAYEKKNSVDRYDQARLALETVRRHRPFISKNIADGAIALLVKALNVIKTYKDIYPELTGANGANIDRKEFQREARDECEALRAMANDLADMIAARLSNMYVGDFEAGLPPS